MAATDPQRQFLALIHDFASERSQGERRVIGLKKRIAELGCQVDVANAEMEEVKRFKETAELELKGYEYQLVLNDVSIQTLEARVSMIQDEISSAGSEVEGLKDEEGASRDKFVRQMFELNTRIRLVSLRTNVNLIGNLCSREQIVYVASWFTVAFFFG
ncbi:hypothetical protein OIU84_024791 [Salix udensis]|uniref:Uncharacterized protein n=1 Tax=Salix udensis TaxID=889485 RepID=A0AAD6KI21_9ROSI|nr:hypothetical protein OIU84_024791 [Salix udensis]